MRNDRDDRDRGKDSHDSKYDERAGTKGTGNRIVDRKYEESQDQANKDRKEQQGKDRNN
jgi:hypothetical protein